MFEPSQNENLSISTALFQDKPQDDEENKTMSQQVEEFVPTKRFTIRHGNSRRVHHTKTFGETEPESAKEVYSAAFGPNDNYVACGYGDGGIRIYNTTTGKKAFHMQQNLVDEMPVTSLRWRPTGPTIQTQNVLVSTHACGHLRHWHVTSGKMLHSVLVAPENDLYSVDYTPDGVHLACGGKDGLVRVFDEKKKVMEFDFKEQGFAPHSNRIFCVKYNPFDPNMIASAGWDNLIVLYDVRQKKPTGSIYGPRVNGEAIDFTDGNILLTGSNVSKESI
jgi:WD40 repeat protein